MIKSETLTKIAPAMVKAQALIASAEKSGVNPHLKNKYANLGDVMDAIKPAMEKNELMFFQTPTPSEDGKLHLETLIIHSSGEFIGGVLVMPLPKQDPQGYGSALTYARRYHLSAMMGVKQDDDDGNAARGSISSYSAIIEACESLPVLQEEYTKAYNVFRGDSASIKVITDAKDKRKAELMTSGSGFNPANVKQADKIEPVKINEPAPSQSVEDF